MFGIHDLGSQNIEVGWNFVSCLNWGWILYNRSSALLYLKLIFLLLTREIFLDGSKGPRSNSPTCLLF